MAEAGKGWGARSGSVMTVCWESSFSADVDGEGAEDGGDDIEVIPSSARGRCSRG